MSDDVAVPPSRRTTLRRKVDRGDYGPERVAAILADGLVAHVAVVTNDGPLVLPMAYGIDGDTMYLHGALANSLLAAGADSEICATVTIIDGLVFAKTPFNHSMNYRSVVVRGEARVVADPDEIDRALHVITDHVAPNWDTTRRPTAREVRATRVVALPLAEASAKVRSGPAVDEPEDIDEPYWSGQIPVTTVFGDPISNDDARAAVPERLAHLAGRDAQRRRDD